MVESEPRTPILRKLSLFVLLGSLLFRAWALPLIRFTGDESHFWATARRIATFQAFPSYGPSLTGSGAQHPGPLFYYLMAIPQRLGASPYLGSAFVMLLHLFAGWLIYRVATQARGERAGLIALGLFAFAPWDILYGSSIWLSSVAPVVGTLILYAATRIDDAPKWQGWLLFFILICPQFHMSAPVVWTAALVLVVAHRPRTWSRRALGFGLAGAVLCYSPAIVAELSSGFANLKAIASEGGGALAWDKVWALPLKVFGYGVLFSTSEIGYQFNRGYWGGNFQESVAYFSSAGLSTWWHQHGLFWGGLGLLSVVVSGLAWLAAWKNAASELRKAGLDLRAMSAYARWTLALTAGFFAASGLLVFSRKLFFPHYVNLLMPAVLLPIAFGFERFVERFSDRGRHLAAVVLALIAMSMASSTSRYLLEIDRLNGLQATIEMSRVVSEEPEPVRLQFRHFNNRYAWHMLSEHLHGRPLRVDDRARVTYRVHNGSVAHEAKRPGEQLFGAVILERVPPR